MRTFLELLGILANLALGLFCLALAILGWIHGGEMAVPLLPVSPESAATALAITGLYASLASLLAFRSGRWARFPLLVWSVGLVVVLVAAVFRSGYRFDGIEAFGEHALQILVATILLGTSFLRFRSASRSNLLRPVTYGRRRWPR